jgi:hypothetical protein
MWPERVEAHDDLMFSDYATNKRLVADRQARYHHQAQQDRLLRLLRLGRRRRRAESDPAVLTHLPAVEPAGRGGQPPLAKGPSAA